LTVNEDWKWQVGHAITSGVELGQRLRLSPSEQEGVAWAEGQGLPLRITPYYFSLIDGDDGDDPIRLQCVPRAEERVAGSLEYDDPLAEETHEVAPFLVRRYPDRALLLATDTCATYCRHCTRRRRVGQGGPRPLAELEPAFRWLEQHPEVKEVLLSGGDPLLASSQWLTGVLSALRRLPHVELIRLGTRVPVTLPQRVDRELVELLRRHGPLYVMTHFNHPREVTDVARQACEALADGGIPLANQTVLLRRVNDCATTLAELSRALLRARVRPYYVMQCDAVRGIGHLRVPIARGQRIMASLRGRLSGLGLPTYVLDLPGGWGKVPLIESAVVARAGDRVILRGSRGREVSYCDAGEDPSCERCRADYRCCHEEV
jgi:lysine 2,3-aminomutase